MFISRDARLKKDCASAGRKTVHRRHPTAGLAWGCKTVHRRHPTAGLAWGCKMVHRMHPTAVCGGSGVGAAKWCSACTLRLRVRRQPQNGALNAPYGGSGWLRVRSGVPWCDQGRDAQKRVRCQPQNGASHAPYGGGSGVGAAKWCIACTLRRRVWRWGCKTVHRMHPTAAGLALGLQNGALNAPYGCTSAAGRATVHRMHPTAARPPPAAKRCSACTLRLRVRRQLQNGALNAPYGGSGVGAAKWCIECTLRLAARPLRRAMV
jgi:hypothetical protein